MLKDPRWDNIPTLAGFALFVASKPADETYIWTSCYDCALGQYLKSIGCKKSNWCHGELATMNALALGDQSPVQSNWTFGKLADRILAHQR